MSSKATVTVSLTNANTGPVINIDFFYLAENSANGLAVGTVVASYPDAGQTKTFSILSGVTSCAFAINASTSVFCCQLNSSKLLSYSNLYTCSKSSG